MLWNWFAWYWYDFITLTNEATARLLVMHAHWYFMYWYKWADPPPPLLKTLRTLGASFHGVIEDIAGFLKVSLTGGSTGVFFTGIHSYFTIQKGEFFAQPWLRNTGYLVFFFCVGLFRWLCQKRYFSISYDKGKWSFLSSLKQLCQTQ